MSVFTEYIHTLRELNTYEEKSRHAEYLVRVLEGNQKRLSAEDKQFLSAFAVGECARLLELIPATEGYAAKDAIFAYENSLMGIIMGCNRSPADLPPEDLATLQALATLVDRERFLEMTLDECFDKGRIPDEADLDRLLCMAVPLKDEYHKGKLWQGLLHYEAELGRLPEATRDKLGRFACSELERHLASFAAGTLTREGQDALEVLADTVAHLVTPATTPAAVAALTAVLEVESMAVRYYALSSLLSMGAPVPAETVATVARDVEYAALLYGTLKGHGMTRLFPAELATEANLAVSGLSRWLTPRSRAISPTGSSIWVG